MNSDPVVAEIRDLRERRAARFRFDIPSIVKDAQQRDAIGDRRVIRRPPRRPIAHTEDSTKATTDGCTRGRDRVGQ